MKIEFLKKQKRPVLLFLFMAMGATIYMNVANAGPNDVLVVVNASVSDAKVSKDDLRNIYLGNKKYWKGQQRIVPLQRSPSHAASSVFFKKILNMSSKEYRLLWRKKELAGEGVEPKTVAKADDILKKVAGRKGSIGYVLRSEYKESSGLKVIHTIPN